MSKKANLLQEIDLLDQQIASLQDYLYETELYPEQVQVWPRLKRSIRLFLVRKQVTRQIQHLHLQRRAFRNCYVYLFKEEPHGRPLEERREPVDTAR